MKRLIAALFLLFAMGTSSDACAQDFSNKGKEFWLSYSYHVGMSGGGLPTMTLYLTSDVTTPYKVEIYGGVVLSTGTLTAGSVVSVDVPTTYVIDAEGLFNGKAVHVTADKPIVTYSYITRSAASAATLCLPTPVLGREYVASSFTQSSNEANSNSYITIVAVEDATTVEIVPSMPTKNGWVAGTTYQVTLNKGQIYQVLGFANANQTSGSFQGNDMSGTTVRSVSTGTTSCKRIAVFSGSGKIKIPSTGCSAASSDNLYQQLYPIASWGKKYLTVPSKNNPFNYYRIYRSVAATAVVVDGVAVPAASFTNNYYTVPVDNRPHLIEADQPISVAQYFTTQGCDGNTANVNDPDMIMLNPVEQNINKVTLVSSNLAAASTTGAPHQHHIHVIMKNSGTGISSFRFDGAAVAANLWTVHPNDASYSYIYLANIGSGNTVGQGFHTISSDSGFLALAYGYASAESYGYSAGANVKDLYQFASIKNEFATVSFPATCRNTPFHFSMTFPYQPTQIRWEFNGLFTDVTINSPVADSVYVVNGKTLYRYSLPGTYAAPTVGTYPIRIIATSSASDGCAGEQEINYDLQGYERPAAAFTFTSTGCANDPVQFTDGSNGQGRPFTIYSWNFGGSNTSAVQNPSFTFATAGNYPVTHYAITDIGCISDTLSQTINVSQPPTANFGISAPYCVGKTISFTDTSLGNGSTIGTWTWNFGDGSPVVNATTNAAQTHSYATAGNYTITLQVATPSGCRSVVFSRTITVSNNPVAAFGFGNECLPGGSVSFTNTSSVVGGTALSYAWNFGVPGGTSILATPSYSYTSTGPFTVTLTATATTGCSNTATQTLNTVYAQPTAPFTVSATPVTDKYCRGANIVFSGNGSAPNSTVAEWHWDFGDGNTSTQQSPTKSYATPGTYYIRHWIKSTIGCVSDTTRDTITIVPQPVASYTIDAHRCAGDSLRFNSNSTASSSTITQWGWTVSGVAQPSVSGYMAYLPPSAASYNVVLTVTTDVGCTDDTTVSVLVHPKPVPNFSMPNICLPAGSGTFNNTTTIADGSISTVTYNWTFSNGGNSTQTSPTHSFTTTGPFDITLVATSADGCVEDTTRQLTTVYAEPQAIFTPGSPEVCLGTAVTFTDASTAPASTVSGWNWNFGDGNTSPDQSPTHTYASSGTYTVTLTVTSAIGCVSSSTSHSVTVNKLPVAQFTTSAATCATRDITFTDASQANSGVLQTWTWDLGDGSPAQNGAGPIIHNYATINNYPVALTVTTDKGCSGTVTNTINVHPLPEPGFVIPQNCLADPFSQFTDTSHIATPDALAGRSWNFGDNFANPPSSNFSTLTNPQHRYTVVGNYQVQLTVTSSNGCSNSITQQVFISNTSPVPVFTIQDNTVCSNDSAYIKDSSWVDIGRIIRIEIWWDASDPSSVQTINNPVAATIYGHKYPEFYNPATSPLNIKVVAYSGQTCGISDTKPLTLMATPDVRFAPVAGVCQNIAPFLVSQASTANASVVAGTPAFSGPGVSGNGQFDPSSAGLGIHSLVYTYTGNNGCVNDTTQTIEVFGVPTVDAGPDKFILEGGLDTLDGSGMGSNLIYVWTPSIYLSDDSIARPLCAPRADQLYKLTVISDDGCTNSDQVFVTMLKSPMIPNVFTPNGDGVNDLWVIQYLESYPGATVEVYNRYGQPVFKSVNYTSAWDGTLNGKPLPVGTYYYLINPKNGRKQMSGFVDIIR
jgi:gliding motility-associated-like protein